MFKNLLITITTAVLFAGCASVPTASPEATATAKQFNAPSSGNAGIYVFRNNSVVGAALKKDVWIDGKCIGETAPGIFFFEEVTGNKQHKVSTESEFSPNDLLVDTQSGKNYFVQQSIKMGVMVGGASLKQVSESEGRKEIAELEMGTKGNCSQ